LKYWSASKRVYVEIRDMHTSHIRNAMAKLIAEDQPENQLLIEALNAELTRREALQQAEGAGPPVEESNGPF